MNETDIRKCIKHGYCWSSYGDHPTKRHIDADTMRNVLSGNKSRHATKREAQAAIDARKADPEPPMWEERKEGGPYKNTDEFTCHTELDLQEPTGTRQAKDWLPVLQRDMSQVAGYLACLGWRVRYRFESPAHVAWRKRQEASKEAPKERDTTMDFTQLLPFSVSKKKETPEQRDVRLKALYKGYCKAGGPITKEQLTDEMREWMHRGSYPYWTGFASDGISPYANAVSCQMGIGTPAMPSPFPNQIEHGRVFWTRADAEHDHFLRTWKGPLTEEAKKKVRNFDVVYAASANGEAVKIEVGPGSFDHVKEVPMFLSESEAKAAAHDLWLADRRENQMEAISEEQRKMLKASDACYFIDFCGCVDSLDADECLYHEAKVYFSVKAAQAALDKAKQPEHKFPKVPSWCPPLLDGDVPLGFGGAFKVDAGLDIELHGTYKNWETAHWDTTGWYGGSSRVFYATPRTSAIAILNYPWLKDEAGYKMKPTDKLNTESDVASHEAPSGESQAKEVSTDETQKPREWIDIPQPLAPRNDPVNHPAHYTSSPSGIECIQVTEWMGFLLGNAVKYIWRAGSKGNEKQDLEKAVWYIRRRIEQIEKEEQK